MATPLEILVEVGRDLALPPSHSQIACSATILHLLVRTAARVRPCISVVIDYGFPLPT